MPEGLTKNGTQRMSGQDLMRKYEQAHKKLYGKKPVIRVVNVADDKSAIATEE